MQFRPISFNDSHHSLKGTPIDYWLRYEEPKSGRPITLNNSGDYYVSLAKVRLVCSHDNFDFLEFSSLPHLQLLAYLDFSNSKTISVVKAIKTATRFVITDGHLESDPIYDFDQAKEALIKAAFQLKPYWITMKLLTYSIVFSTEDEFDDDFDDEDEDDVAESKNNDLTEVFKIIKRAIRYPMLIVRDVYDVNPDELEEEELDKHRIVSKTLYLDGEWDEDECEYVDDKPEDLTDEQAETLYNEYRPQVDQKLNEMVEKVQNIFLKEARKSATEEEIQRWLNKVEKYAPTDREQAYSSDDLMDIDRDMCFDDAFSPSRITANGDVEIDGIPRAVK